jgi:thiamine biosynthesis lipoprotein
MKQTKIMMGMTINVEIVDPAVKLSDFERVFAYFKEVDNRFSTYKDNSEISKINQALIAEKACPARDYSPDMAEVFKLSEQTKKETAGYFDIVNREGKFDPSGLVKGWAIYKAAEILWRSGLNNFYLDAGGDIQTSGKDSLGQIWTVGIRNPFKQEEIVKVLTLDNKGVATSGTYLRGQHVYNPHRKEEALNDIISFTVVGPNVYEADRFATAVFAMGREGISFVENLAGFEGYMIDAKGIATFTSGFSQYVKKDA